MLLNLSLSEPLMNGKRLIDGRGMRSGSLSALLPFRRAGAVFPYKEV